MGNSAATGHAANYVQDGAAMMGIQSETFGFKGTAKAVMRLGGIESWSSRSLVAERLQRQLELAGRSPLRHVAVERAVASISAQSWRSRSGVLTLWQARGVCIRRDEFVQACMEMVLTEKDANGHPISVVGQDREDLRSIFDSMDFDGNGTLGTGEWAGLCSIFFRGSMQESLRAVFAVLDEDSSNTLTREEVQEYLRPYVRALMPDGALALEPMLLKRTTEQIFQEMDGDRNGSVTCEELIAWTQHGGSIIDSLADIIDAEVYRLWIEEAERRRHKGIGEALVSWAAGWPSGDDVSATPCGSTTPGSSPPMSACNSEATPAAAPAPESRGCPGATQRALQLAVTCFRRDAIASTFQ